MLLSHQRSQKKRSRNLESDFFVEKELKNAVSYGFINVRMQLRKTLQEKKISNREKKRMQMKLRKLWPAFGLMCMSLFSTASAQHPYGTSSQSDSMSPQGSMDEHHGTYQRGTYREITPNAGPRVAHGADALITADFIWWKAVQEGTEYAATGFSTETPAGQQYKASRGNKRTAGEEWSPGFKVGLGLNMNYDGWDIYAEYTWLRPSNTSSLSGKSVVPTAKLPPLAQSPDVVGERISAEWDLDFNAIDLELGRNFYLSQFLTMRPFTGLKGTWQDQYLTTRVYNSAGFEVGENINFQGPYTIHKRNENWGLGVRTGLNLSWYMGKNWSVYSNLAWTAMWVDETQDSRKDTIPNPTKVNSLSEAVIFDVENDNLYPIRNIMELELGLRWEMWFSDDNYHFSIQAGWEEQIWMNWLHAKKDLTFQGLNLKFRFDF